MDIRDTELEMLQDHLKEMEKRFAVALDALQRYLMEKSGEIPDYDLQAESLRVFKSEFKSDRYRWDFDDYGYCSRVEQRVSGIIRFLFHKYWRVKLYGLRNIPSEQPAILVANRAGTFPYDGFMLRYAIRNLHSKGRDLRILLEDEIYHLPFVGTFLSRIGWVRASPQNAMRLLRDGYLICVFPEGVKGMGKLYRDRYRLQRFGRGGFIRISIMSNSPIIPVCIVGSEDTNPLLKKITWVSRLIGFPYFPITPTFPLLGPLGLLPMPVKWLRKVVVVNSQCR